MVKVAGQEISAKTIERVVHDVGSELAQRRDAHPRQGDSLAARPEAPPKLAVVECDGGRIRMRQPGYGPCVHLGGEGWRETKNACLIRASHKTFNDDPQPDPPECFCNAKHVAKIAETEELSVAAPPTSKADSTGGADDGEDLATIETEKEDWRPKRQVRTVLSSMARSKDFRWQMKREAQQRRFFEAEAKAFLGAKWHIPVETMNKARSYRSLLKGTGVVVRRTSQSNNLSDLIQGRDHRAWVVANRIHSGGIRKDEKEANIALAHIVAEQIRGTGQTAVYLSIFLNSIHGTLPELNRR